MSKERLHVMLDLDGTVVKGPTSWGSLTKLFVERRFNRTTGLVEDVSGNGVSSLAVPWIFAVVTEYNRFRHGRRELDPQAVPMMLGLRAVEESIGMDNKMPIPSMP